MHSIETPKANPERLLAIVKDAYEGKVVVPEFQRSFVWERIDIQELLTSSLQGYFIGTFLMLDTPASNPMFPFRPIEGLEQVSNQACFNNHSTVRLVLDGQQRITSVFYALYGPDIPLRNSKYPHKFYLLLDAALNGDLEDVVVGVSVLDRRRMSEIQELVRTHRALPFGVFLEPSTFYRWLYQEQQAWDGEARSTIETLFQRFQNFMVPVVSLSPDAGTDNIVNIFERINRTGVSLSLFDLAVARLYPRGIRLRDLWEAFKDAHGDCTDIIWPEDLLRVIAILEGKEPRKGNLLRMLDGLDAETFVNRWKDAGEALCAARKRIERLYGAYDKTWIPYATMVVPLAVLLFKLKEMKAGEEAYRKVDRWYWASVFTQRYDSAVDTKSFQDVRDVLNWVTSGAEPDWFRRVSAQNVDLYVAERRSAVYRGVMCLILRKGAHDFLTGQKADLHTCQDDHIFPHEVYKDSYPVDVILNRTLISRETNNRKRKKRPSEFFNECLEGHNNDEARLLGTLETHFITKEAYEALIRDDFDEFIKHRETALRKAIDDVL
ncbi:MAG: hypothetical protein PWQ13_275 [Bacillota bacterium]|nr:hypothetical protein [Bacillota bacterium]